MTLPTTTPQGAALAAPVARVAYFVEFDFAGNTSRMSTLGQTITWGGYDWLGVGTLGSISEVSESDSLTTSSVTFTLNAAQQSWLALAVGPVETYRGRTAKMYFCPLDASFNLIDIPVQCWSGVMDMVTVGVDGEAGQITLKCETSAYGLKRANSFRINAAQQKAYHPTDTGLDYLSDLISNPVVWLTVKFQQK
jgi:hypothetical protein